MDNLQQHIEHLIAQRDMTGLIAAIPYARLLNIQSLSADDDFLFILPKNDDIIGNPTIPSIHGGVMGGFMETSGALYTMMQADSYLVPKIVDFSIDYLRPGLHNDTFARCTIVKSGKKVSNVSISCWQTDEAKPIATARGHFLLI